VAHQHAAADDRASPRELAARVERAEAEGLARTGPPGFGAALACGGGLAVSKGAGSRVGAALGLGLDGPVSAAELDRAERHLGAGGGVVRIEVAAPAHPSLGEELGRRGYLLERMLLVWIRPPLPLPPARSGAEVRAIRRGEEQAWAEVFSLAGLGRRPGRASEVAALLAMTIAPGNVCFGAFEDGALAGVALAAAHRGIAMLGGAGVLLAHRGHGLHRALVRARLAWAAARGCDLAAAATAPGSVSQRTLERAGFRCAYPKAVMVRGPERAAGRRA
jgi:GNAT superfamily N-acetyltransferase